MPADAPTSTPLAKGTVAVLALVVLVLGAVYLIRASGGGRSGGGAPALAGPVFLNANADVAYTGVAACARCHQDRYASYLATGHSRSLAAPEPAKEEVPATYHHRPSDMRYRMYEKDDALHIEERLRLDSGDEHVLADHAVAWRLGSGAHARSYLVEIDGFLNQAPVTWYAGGKGWGITPGYDNTWHLGFSAPAGEACLHCHAGRAELIDEADRIRLHEHAIGCERCHGPGRLHDDLHSREGSATEAGGDDLTIVDPKSLPRDQELALCAQCHMDYTLTVVNPGRRLGDWRPGGRENEVMVTYRTKLNWGFEMVGHVDPLRQSRCFQGSERLTCTTCHLPHQAPPREPAARRAHYNGICLTCHEHCTRVPDEGPGIVPPEGDNCIGCHMPRGEEYARHTAVTGHRVRIPGLTVAPPKAMPELPELEPIGDVGHLPENVRDRNLGLAYLMLARRHSWPVKLVAALHARGMELIELAVAEEVEDAEAEAVLARHLRQERKFRRAVHHARAALARAEAGGLLSAGGRAVCLGVLIDDLAGTGQRDEARALLERLVKLRREPGDALHLLEMLGDAGAAGDAVALARQTLALWPENSEVQYRAGEVFGLAGDAAAQKRHGLIGTQLHLQQSRGTRFLERK